MRQKEKKEWIYSTKIRITTLLSVSADFEWHKKRHNISVIYFSINFPWNCIRTSFWSLLYDCCWHTLLINFISKRHTYLSCYALDAPTMYFCWFHFTFGWKIIIIFFIFLLLYISWIPIVYKERLVVLSFPWYVYYGAM